MTLTLDSLKPSKNTAELVADVLRDSILQGKIPVGEPLRQDTIASELSVSKIPVREALVKLQAEGLVEITPNRGAMVKRLSSNEIIEIYDMRLALEPLVLRHAIPYLTEKDFIEIEYILQRIDQESDLSQWVGLNWEFHHALYAPSVRWLTISTIKALHNNVVRYLGSSHLDEDYLAQSQEQHRHLLELCREGQTEAACSYLVHHLSDAETVVSTL